MTSKYMTKNNVASVLLAVLIGVFVALTLGYVKNHPYKLTTDEQVMTYKKGVVLSVESEDLVEDTYNPNGYQGQQLVKVLVKEGVHKGEEVEVTNYLSTTYYVYLEEGDTVLLCIEDEDSDSPYYMIQQYYRLPVLLVLLGILAFVIVLVGGKKGVKTLFALAFDLYALIGFALPLIYNGYSPIVVSIITVILITAVTLFLLNGYSEKTFSAIAATGFGVILSGIVFVVFSNLLHITGYSASDSESLLVLVPSRGLQLRYMLFASILIASLGAVMDVGMSIASSLYEMRQIDPNISMKRLYHAGISVGRDMIGTMTNTLVLAFAGGSFITMLVYAVYNMDLRQLMTADYIVIEVLQGVSGTLAVVLTVPIGSLISAWLYTKHFAKENQRENPVVDENKEIRNDENRMDEILEDILEEENIDSEMIVHEEKCH